MAGNALGYVLQPTELANEAAIRLIRTNLSNAKDQGHLLAVAARTMRNILIDEARKQASAKRCPPALHTIWPGAQTETLLDLRELDAALAALHSISPARAKVVELRFMLGMTVAETAQALHIPERTIKRHWQAARAWLLDYLNVHAGIA